MHNIDLPQFLPSRKTSLRMDFGFPYAPIEAPQMRPLPFDDAGVFEAPPPFTAGYDSYESWTKKKSLRLHHIIEVESGFASRSGNVFDAEGRRVEMASHKSKANKGSGAYTRNAWKSVKPLGLKPTVFYDGDVIIATSSTAKFYYHYLLEVVPRLHVAQKMGWAPKLPVYVDVSQPFMQECLRALQIENIIDASVYPRIQARKLIVPCYEIGSYDSIPKWSIDLLNELFPDKSENTAKADRRLYLSRKNTKRRTIVNEIEVSKLFGERGFEMVFSETLTIQQQAELFRQASIVVGPSGGAFTNIAFCRPQTKILNLFHWQADNSLQKLSAAVGLQYSYVATRPTLFERLYSLSTEIEIGNKDIFIEPSDLKNTLEKILE